MEILPVIYMSSMGVINSELAILHKCMSINVQINFAHEF